MAARRKARPSVVFLGVYAQGDTKAAAKQEASRLIEEFARQEYRASMEVLGGIVISIRPVLAGGWSTIVFDPSDYPGDSRVWHSSNGGGSYDETRFMARIHALTYRFVPGDPINPPDFVTNARERQEYRNRAAFQNAWLQLREQGMDEQEAHRKSYELSLALLADCPDPMPAVETEAGNE